MIDLDKWAAVSTDDLRRAADLLEQSDFAFAKTRLAAQEIAARLRAARPTDAPTLIDPARLRELERDAARLDFIESQTRKSYTGTGFDYAGRYEDERGGYRMMWHHKLNARFKTVREAIDAALQEQPR